MRDYIYIPLGGNKKGSFRTYNNLMATFVIGGLWHGAGWTFVFWGFLHGAALAVQKLWSKLGFKLWTWFAWLITFNFVNIAWVFFRAKEWEDAVKVLGGMFGLSGIYVENLKLFDLIKLNLDTLKLIPLLEGIKRFDLAIYIMIAILSVIILFYKNSIELLADFKSNKFNLYFGLIAFLVSILFMNSFKETEFLYFNF
jgi:hypothetical protein